MAEQKFVSQNLVEEIEKETEKILKKKTVESIDFSGYQAYLLSGERLTFENQYFARRKQLTVLSLAFYLDSSRTDVLEMLEEVIWAICGEYSWALPAHLPVVEGQFYYSGDSFQWIDLFAAETAQSLSEIMELFKEKFSAQLLVRIKHEIEIRILEPLEDQKWDWEWKENNWSAVIAGCLGMTILTQLELHSFRQEKLLKRLEQAFNSYLRSFKADGVCVEGVGYWAYGFGYYCYFAKKYLDIYHSDHFFHSPKLKAIAEFPFYAQIGENRFVPFSDAHGEELPSGLVTFCSEYFQVKVPSVRKAASLFSDSCYRWAPAYRNLIWTKESAAPGAEQSHYFRDAEWLVMRNQRDDFVFAGKGGRNDESHNHNDAGHFVIGTQEQLLLTDLGAGEYTKDYFNDHSRYQILNNRSLGHSVPFINGQEQKNGNYGAEHASCEAVSKDQTIFSMQLQQAYGKNAGIGKYRREWRIDSKQREILLWDEMDFFENSPARIRQNFISEIEPVIEADHIRWIHGKDVLVLKFSPVLDEVRVIQEVFKDHQGIQKTIHRVMLINLKNSSSYQRKYLFKLMEVKGG